MALDIVPLIPLERGQLHVLRLRAMRSAAWMMAIAAGVVLILPLFEDELPAWLIAWRWAALALAGIALWKVAVAPGREWRRCGYAFTGSELHIASGWWTRIHIIVPVSRVQHIDVMQGPAERMFGVARLVLFTAGSEMPVLPLGGITRETAEEIRDAIRVKIGSAG